MFIAKLEKAKAAAAKIAPATVTFWKPNLLAKTLTKGPENEETFQFPHLSTPPPVFHPTIYLSSSKIQQGETREWIPSRQIR